jgi:SulP family sulfate permease
MNSGRILQSRYQSEWIRADVVAGVTTAAVVIPKAIAFAGIAGLPLETGLYVALVPMFVYALLGTSRVLSVSSTSTLAILTASELATAVPDGNGGQLLVAAATLAVLVGLFLILAGILRLGFIAHFISLPVLTGFKAGIGIVIVVDQLPKLVGVHIDKIGFFQDCLAIFQHLPDASVPTVILGGVILSILFGLERFLPRAPAPLAAVIIGTTASALLSLGEHGVAVVGRLPGGLPSFSGPEWALVSVLWPGALGIALMCFIESIAAGRAFARRNDPQVLPNRELVALGVANLIAGLFHGFPAGGGTSQTAVNSQAGARSQLAELVTVSLVVATLLVLSPLIALLPQAALAAVVIVTTLPLLSARNFREIARVRHTELWWALVATAGVIFLGTLLGILVAVAVSVLTLLYQANHPPIYVLARKRGTEPFIAASGTNPEEKIYPGLLMVRTEGRMNFASAPNIRDKLMSFIEEADPKVVIIDCSAIPDIEYTALQALSDLDERLCERGIALWLAGLNREPLRVLKRSPLGKKIEPGRIHPDLNAAINAYTEMSSEITQRNA